MEGANHCYETEMTSNYLLAANVRVCQLLHRRPLFPPHLSVFLLWWRGTFQAGLKHTPFFFLFLMLKQKRLQLSNKACVTQRTAAACSG